MKTAVLILRSFASFYALLYLMGFGFPVLLGEYSQDSFENTSVLLMCLLFCIALVICWFRLLFGGVLFLLWFIGIFILSFYFWEGAGVAFVLSTPMAIVAVAMIILGYKMAIKRSHT